MGRTRVFVLDSHPVVLTGLRKILDDLEDFEVVGEARPGPDALVQAKSVKPEMVITDILMPIERGLEILARLRATAPSATIVLFTGGGNKGVWDECFQAGADVFLARESRIAYIGRLFQAVRRGEIGWRNGRPRSLLGGSGLSLDELYPWSGGRPLSPREREVFKHLAEGHSIRETAAQLGTSPKTVESQKYRIMEKLQAHTMADILRIAFERRVIVS